MKYELVNELSPLSLAVKSEQGEERILDRLEFPVPPKEQFRVELQKGFKEAAQQTAAIEAAGLLKYDGLEKYDENFYLVRGDQAKTGPGETGLKPFQTVSPEETGRVLLQIIELLKCYHQHGLVSGGLSPGQLKQDQSGRFYLQDPLVINYLSKSLPEEYKIDTPPEVIRGKPWDQRSDLFSWGVLAYRLLTARDPFAAATPAERMDKILKLGVLSPRDIQPELNAGLSRLITNCLSVDPQKRPSLDEVSAKLTQLLENGTFIADENEVHDYREKALANRRRYQAKERFWLWFRKYGIAALITCAAICLIVLTWFGSRSKPVITAKNKPGEVLAYYFKGIQMLDPTLVDETLHKAENSFSGMVTNLFVINRTQQGMAHSTKDNVKLDFVKLNLEPLLQNDAQVKYKANYTLKVAFAKEIQYIEREDIIVLQPVRKVWRITKIDVSNEKRWKEQRVEEGDQAPPDDFQSPAAQGPGEH
jgi:hypothetical protein